MKSHVVPKSDFLLLSLFLPTLSFNIHNCLSSETPPSLPTLSSAYVLPSTGMAPLCPISLRLTLSPRLDEISGKSPDFIAFNSHPASRVTALGMQHAQCHPNTHIKFSPAPPDPLTLRAENMPLHHGGTRFATPYVCVGVNEKKGNVQKGQRGKEAVLSSQKSLHRTLGGSDD